MHPCVNGCRNISSRLQISLRIVYRKFNGTVQLLRNFIVRYVTHVHSALIHSLFSI